MTPSSTTHTGELLSYREAAAACRVSRRTFLAWVAGGRVPVLRLPGRIRRVRRSDIEAFLANARVG